MPTDAFAPPPPDAAAHRAKTPLCREREQHGPTDGPTCPYEHRCVLYRGHGPDVAHKADRCGHRWPVDVEPELTLLQRLNLAFGSKHPDDPPRFTAEAEGDEYLFGRRPR